jgi:hypothetical protein
MRIKRQVNSKPSTFWSMKVNPGGASVGNFVQNMKTTGTSIMNTIKRVKTTTPSMYHKTRGRRMM